MSFLLCFVFDGSPEWPAVLCVSLPFISVHKNLFCFMVGDNTRSFLSPCAVSVAGEMYPRGALRDKREKTLISRGCDAGSFSALHVTMLV